VWCASVGGGMDDAGLIRRFESCAIPLDEWDHKMHLRVTYAYLRDRGLVATLAALREGIPRHNAAHSVPEAIGMGYHDTLTEAWCRIVWAMMRAHGDEGSGDAFIKKHTQLHSKVLLRLYYSRDRIMSVEAKARFVEPDLAPLPVVH
jgi:hypothetical protein